MRLAWLLCLVAGLGGELTIRAADAQGPGTPAQGQAYRNLGVEEFDKLRADTNVVVLDVRTAREFAAGHIPGAINVDWNAPDFEKKIAAVAKNKTYLVNCRSGRRSAAACEVMSGKLGFRRCYNLEGGMIAWERSGKPVKK
jgi:rhodanese-related sulfurtransferase